MKTTQRPTLDPQAVGPEPGEDLERTVREALRGLRFGSVEITVHNSRVVQIERREKMRFDER